MNDHVKLIHYQVDDGVCVLRFNHPPLNTMTLGLLDELRAGIRQANEDGGVRGVVITGDPDNFSAGADINLFKAIQGDDDATQLSQRFQEAFGEVENSSKPVVAALAGKVLGGALELAMACHYRVCDRNTRLSLPEVNLGINPGAGGTQRLPRLVGVDAALKMLLTGQMVSADEGLRLGLVDEVCNASDVLAGAAKAAATAAGPRPTCARTEKISDRSANEIVIARARQTVGEHTRSELVAPAQILRAVETGVLESFEAGLHKERSVFARCMRALGTRNKIHVFFATRDTAKGLSFKGAEERPVAKVAVIGMGSMGSGIAQAVMMAGLPVIGLDENAAALEKGRARITESFQKRASQGKMSAAKLAATLELLQTTTDWNAIAKVDLVIEAAFEDVAVKRSVIANAEKCLAPEALIATNTSTISLDALAQGMSRPERFLGLHFFNPAHAMPLVEVIHRTGTSPATLAAALRFTKTIRKTPVLVRNREGFLVNRIFIPYLMEAFWLLEEGAAPEAIDAAMAAFGFPMGPLTLIDMAGLDILVHCHRVMVEAFPQHGPLSAVATTLVERGMLGQKRGLGVYRYEPGDRTPRPSLETQAIIAEARRRSGLTARAFSLEEITQRLTLRLVGEACWVMEEKLVQRESDVDAASVLGLGFPDYRGGVLKYARDIGLDVVREQLQKLAETLTERYAPASLLTQNTVKSN